MPDIYDPIAPVCVVCEDVITDDEGRTTISDGRDLWIVHVDCAEADDA